MRKFMVRSIAIFTILISIFAGKVFAEVEFDGIKWYISENPEKLIVNERGHLVWQNPHSPEQVTAYFPPIDLSDVGDIAQIVYLFKTEGSNTGERGTDPMMLSGTGDIRIGVFDSNGGEKIDKDGFGYRGKHWCGYLGYCARICPHLQAGIKREHSDAIPGKIMKRINALKDDNCESLVQSAGSYRGSSKDISGFDLKFGEFSPLVIKLERKSTEKVIYWITLNNVTYDFVDDNPEVQPKKIDTIAFYYPNPKKYNSIILAGPWFSRTKCTSQVTNSSITNTIVYAEKNKFCAWPANNGVWSWDNEILVGFSLGKYREKKNHNITSPSRNVLGRSLAGGETWKLEDPDNFVSDGKETTSCPGDINFAHPEFAMRVSGNSFFISYDKGHNWDGPYSFGNLSKDEQLKGLNITSRTDYMALGENQCLIFKSAKPSSGGFGTDRAFVTKTTDGGASFEFVSWMASFDDPYRAVMPSTVRCSGMKLVSALRRRNMNNRDQRAWVDVFVSDDNGTSWSFLSQVGITGGWNGNPPAMVQTQDGRLCCVYGNRDSKTINVRYSSDQGKSWGKEYTLRNDYQVDSFNDPDLGYPRLVVRPDGKLTAMYYWATLEHPHHHIAATIWDPTEDK